MVTRRRTPLERSAMMTVYRRASMCPEKLVESSGTLSHGIRSAKTAFRHDNHGFGGGEDPAKTVLPFATMRRIFITLTAIVASAIAIRAQDIGPKDLADGLTNPSRWLTYSGDYSGQRFSPLTEITAANVERLAAQWTFQTGVVNTKLEATPLVIDGVLYLTGGAARAAVGGGPGGAGSPGSIVQHAWAIDGRTAKPLWHYQRTLPDGLKVCCGLVNRGFAVYHDRLFLVTLDAHVVALE